MLARSVDVDFAIHSIKHLRSEGIRNRSQTWSSAGFQSSREHISDLVHSNGSATARRRLLRFIREVGSPKGILLSYQVTPAGERRLIWKVQLTLRPDHAPLIHWSSRERGPHAGALTHSSRDTPLPESTATCRPTFPAILPAPHVGSDRPPPTQATPSAWRATSPSPD